MNFGKTDPSVNIRVLAGEDPDALGDMGRFYDTGDITEVDRLDLSSAARGDKPVYVRLEMNARGLPESVLSWVAVHRVRFTTPWDERVTPAWEQDWSLATQRKQNLVVSWRSDAERAIADLANRVASGDGPDAARLGRRDATPRARLAAARAAYREGSYGSAVRLASAGLAACLPAAYEVLEPGWLDPYPVRVEASSPVSATVDAWARDEVRLRVGAEASTAVRVTLAGLAPGRYAVERKGDTWTVRPGAKGAFRAGREGRLTFRATAPPHPRPPLARTVAGTFQGTAARSGEAGVYPDAGGRTAIRTGPDTVILRGARGEEPGPARLADLQRGDRVAARIGPDGIATWLRSEYEVVEGMLAAFAPMTPHAMPSLNLTGGGNRVIDLSAPLHVDGTDLVLRTRPVGFAPLKPGDRVRVRCDPKTGRIYELWKLAA